MKFKLKTMTKSVFCFRSNRQMVQNQHCQVAITMSAAIVSAVVVMAGQMGKALPFTCDARAEKLSSGFKFTVCCFTAPS